MTLLLALSACAPDDDIDVRTEALADFAIVDLRVPVHLTLSEAPAATVTATGPTEAIDGLAFAVVGDRLTITTSAPGGWLSPKQPAVTLALAAPPLRQLNIYEGAAVTTATALTGEDFEVVFRGKVGEADVEYAGPSLRYRNNGATAGRLRLRGRTDRLTIRNIALATVEAGALEARVAEVFNASRGDVTVAVTDSLTYRIEGSGDVVLAGEAHVIAEGESGGGRLRRR